MLLCAPSVQYSLLKQAILSPSPTSIRQPYSIPGPVISSSLSTPAALTTCNDVPASSGSPSCLDPVIRVNPTCMPKCVPAPSSTLTATEFMAVETPPHVEPTQSWPVPIQLLVPTNMTSAPRTHDSAPSPTSEASSVLRSSPPDDSIITAPTGTYAWNADLCTATDAPERATSSTEERGILRSLILNPARRNSPQRASSPSPVLPHQAEVAGAGNFPEGTTYA